MMDTKVIDFMKFNPSPCFNYSSYINMKPVSPADIFLSLLKSWQTQCLENQQQGKLHSFHGHKTKISFLYQQLNTRLPPELSHDPAEIKLLQAPSKYPQENHGCQLLTVKSEYDWNEVAN